MRCLLVALSSSLSLLVVVASACDLFALQCVEDPNCPESVPYCVDGICVDEAEAERRGRDVSNGPNEGEGEGEGDTSCTGDGDCDGGLCYDLTDTAAHFEADRVGTCVPGADEDASCSEASLFSARTTGGPVIFGASATLSTADCSPDLLGMQVTVLYLDREGDFDFSGATLAVMPEGGSSPEFAGGSISGDGTSGEGFFFVNACVPATTTRAALQVAGSGFNSNALCVAVAPLP